MRVKEYALYEDGRSVGIRSYHSILSPQRRPYNAHHHTECEISFFIKGSGTYGVRGKSYDFKAGDIFIFGSNEEHCITEISTEIDLLNIQFEPYMLWESPDTMDILALFNARSDSFENRFRGESESIGKYLLLLQDELCDKQACYAVTVKYLLFMALTSVIRKYSCIDREKSVKASGSVAQSLRITIDYIRENLENRLTLKELAGVACLSPTYFSYVFKKFNGISLWEYINIKRVEKAVEMLKGEKMTKLEIAERCGFSSSSNFYKTFTAVTGKVPSDFLSKNPK